MNLKRLLFAFTALFLPFTFNVHAADVAALDKLNKQMLSPTVRIDDDCSGSIIWSGREKSGDISTYVLTAQHCLNDSPSHVYRIDVPVYQDHLSLVGQESYFATVQSKGSSADAAVLVLKDKKTLFDNVAIIAPADTVVYPGEATWAVGYPRAKGLTITEGVLGYSERVTIDGVVGSEVEYLRSTADIAPGSSGGALYHQDEYGAYELIGTATASYNGYPFMTLWTPIWSLRDYLGKTLPDIFSSTRPTWPGHN